MQIIGHERVRNFLSSITADNFPHTLLITGPAGVGKTTVALAAAAALIGCDATRAETHPNIIRVTAGEDPKTHTPRAAIPVAAIRELRSLFHIHHSEPRIILIERAEELQQESSNALLKVMEEPNTQIYFMILARSDEAVLQTIKSRAAHIQLSNVPTGILRAGLAARGFSSAEIDRAAAIAGGRPGVALRYLENAEFRERVITESTRFNDLFRAKTLGAAEKILSDLFGKKERHIEVRKELVEMLEWWMMWLSEKNPTHPAIAQIAKTIPLLSENMHPRLLVERIVIELQS
ncbi:MAG: AAA family ATPase [Candidatus Magasanikbacteria bacterium]|nr:AAA family ATPase [Candidatus Magasanikbacteria bacterium]